MSPPLSLLVAVPKPRRTSRGKRRARLRAKDFGERAAAVKAMSCLAFTRPALFYGPRSDGRTPCAGEIEPAHAKSRGAGGDRRHLVPLCSGHHREQHTRGVLTFQTKYQLNLLAEADRIATYLDTQGLP